jgi:hypothetical protein
MDERTTTPVFEETLAFMYDELNKNYSHCLSLSVHVYMCVYVYVRVCVCSE